MRRKSLWGTGTVLFLLTISFLLAPFVGKAQALSPKFTKLDISLWPEYDRPEVLVIYRGRLNSDISLPVLLTFRLPGYVDEMYAVAIETSEGLVNVDPETIELQPEGDDLLLTFPTSSFNIQFEYYDPVILSRQDQNRQLIFDFVTPYAADLVSFEVQQPFGTENFSLIPEPDNIFTGDNRLKYSTIQIAGLAAGEIFELSATYQRSTDQLSTQALTGNAPVPILDLSELISDLLNNERAYLGYVLIGIGVLLLLGIGGYGWRSRQMNNKPEIIPRQVASSKNPRQQTRRKKRQESKPDIAPLAIRPAIPSTTFCYRCGIFLRDDANFCHACGAERRQ